LDLPSGQIVFTRTVWMDPDDPSPAGGACHIFIMNTDGTGVQDLTPTSRTCNTAPAYSPDGALIAYVEGQRSSGNTIWITSADGSNARQLSS
jgi:Tol biopolymer transport system component